MIGSTGPLSNISSAINTTTRQLSDALTRIASGKKFRNASEDLGGFIRAQNLKVNIGGYEDVQQELTAFKSYTSAAVQASGSIYESLTEMKDLAQKYGGASADLQAEYAADWNALKTGVTKTIAATAVDGDVVTRTGIIKTVDLDPDGTESLDMNFTLIADVSLLDVDDDITADNGLNEQISNMLSYMSEAKSFDAIVDQQLSLTETILSSKKAVMSLITDIDDADEMNKVLDLSLRRQAGIAMMAQGNMVQNSMSKLYEL